jgi:hypothetical protein
MEILSKGSIYTVAGEIKSIFIWGQNEIDKNMQTQTHDFLAPFF